MTGRGGGMGRGALCDNGSNMSLRGIPVSAGMTWQSGSPGGEDTLKGKAMSPLLAAGYCPKSQGRFSVSLTQRTVPVILEGESGGTCPRVTHTLTLHWVPVRGSSVRAGGDLIRHGFAVPPSPKGEGYTAPTGCCPKREGRHSARAGAASAPLLAAAQKGGTALCAVTQRTVPLILGTPVSPS